jgi:argininosuccinate lyase
VTDELMWTFNASIDFDRRLAAVDVRGSMAYARALAGPGSSPRTRPRGCKRPGAGCR